MLNLKTLQAHFFQGIINSQDNQLLQFIKPSNISQELRFQIYKNSSFENLYNSLKLTFPGVWKLIGEDCARGVSNAFTRDIKNLPTSGYIDDWGKEFPPFLSNVRELSELKYLEDYAYFEWLQHLSYCAPDAHVFDPIKLQKLPPDSLGSIKFVFHPSVFLFKSEYPLDQIYELLEEPSSQITNVNLNAGASHIIINRKDDYVSKMWVIEEYFKFINLLVMGNKLEKAISEIEIVNSKFDFSEALSFILSNKLLTSIITENK